MWRSVAAATGLVMVVSMASIALDQEPAEAASIPIGVTTSRPLPGEHVGVRGAVRPAKRKVVLQVARNGRWVSARSTRTVNNGRYAFRVKGMLSGQRLRVVAPAARIGGKRYATRVSRAVGVRARAGSGTLSFASAPIGQTRGGTAHRTPAATRFKPARPGQPVRVQRWTGSRWVQVARARQDAGGVTRFNVPAIAPGNTTKYRALTNPGRGARTIVTRQVTPAAQQWVFREEFSNSSWRQRWATRSQDYHGRRMCARPNSNRVTVSKGVATLSVKRIRKGPVRSPGDRRTTCPQGLWDNAMIGTGRADSPFSLRYGTVAARIRFQPGQGMGSAFWLQQMDSRGTEIDIAEYYGDANGAKLQTKVHDLSRGHLRTHGGTMDLSSVLSRGKTPSDGWHVYSVQWTPTRYVFRVDGVITMTTARPRVSQGQQEIILSLLTSDWALDGKTRSSSKMYVDWVRAWQDPRHVEAS